MNRGFDSLFQLESPLILTISTTPSLPSLYLHLSSIWNIHPLINIYIHIYSTTPNPTPSLICILYKPIYSIPIYLQVLTYIILDYINKNCTYIYKYVDITLILPHYSHPSQTILYIINLFHTQLIYTLSHIHYSPLLPYYSISTFHSISINRI